MRNAVLLVALGLATLPGCGMTTSLQQASRETFNLFRPRESDFGLKEDEEKHQWDVVGEHARGVRGTVRDTDHWFKDYIQSERANDIERSLGVD